MKFSVIKMLIISAFCLDKQKSFVLKKICEINASACHFTVFISFHWEYTYSTYIQNVCTYFQGVFYAIVINGLNVLRVCFGSLPIFLCNIAGFLKGCAITFGALTITMYTLTRFMFVCIWNRMRQMDDNLIVRIATIQAIFMTLLIQAFTWFQLQRQPTIPVSLFKIIIKPKNIAFDWSNFWSIICQNVSATIIFDHLLLFQPITKK